MTINLKVAKVASVVTPSLAQVAQKRIDAAKRRLDSRPRTRDQRRRLFSEIKLMREVLKQAA